MFVLQWVKCSGSLSPLDAQNPHWIREKSWGLSSLTLYLCTAKGQITDYPTYAHRDVRRRHKVGPHPLDLAWERQHPCETTMLPLSTCGLHQWVVPKLLPTILGVFAWLTQCRTGWDLVIYLLASTSCPSARSSAEYIPKDIQNRGSTVGATWYLGLQDCIML